MAADWDFDKKENREKTLQDNLEDEMVKWNKAVADAADKIPFFKQRVIDAVAIAIEEGVI